MVGGSTAIPRGPATFLRESKRFLASISFRAVRNSSQFLSGGAQVKGLPRLSLAQSAVLGLQSYCSSEKTHPQGLCVNDHFQCLQRNKLIESRETCTDLPPWKIVSIGKTLALRLMSLWSKFSPHWSNSLWALGLLENKCQQSITDQVLHCYRKILDRNKKHENFIYNNILCSVGKSFALHCMDPLCPI